MLIDARNLPRDAVLSVDLCIVGGGPAGLAIADRLRTSGLRIAVVEAGGLEQTVRGQQQLRGELIGHRTYPLHTSRFRVLGGSGNRWGGWSRPLEKHDFDDWPMSADDLAEYDKAAAIFLGLVSHDFDLSTWADRLPPPLPIDGDMFTNEIIQVSPRLNFGRDVGAGLLKDPQVDVLVNGQVVDLRLAPGTNRISDVVLHGGAVVRGRAVVLAAGAIENARLLLASRRDRPAGLGNDRDQVGRYFMEHPHVLAGHLALANPAGGRCFYSQEFYGDAQVLGVVTPTIEARRRHGLLGAAITLHQPLFRYGQPFLNTQPQLTVWPGRAHRRIAGAQTTQVVRHRLLTGVRYAWYAHQSVPRRSARPALTTAMANGLPANGLRALMFRTEQLPNKDSRVTLADRRDSFGLPGVRLDWRVASDDIANIERTLSVLDGVVRERRLGRVIGPQPGWDEHVTGGPHHMGTTRMSATPADGVVDANCRVHSVENLYVAGSSVFRTCGYANPTFTLTALALRLADELRSVLD